MSKNVESSSDATASSQSNNHIAVNNDVMDAESLDTKTQTLTTTEPSSGVQDLVDDDARVSGGQIGDMIGADLLLESKSGTLITDHDGGGDIIAQDTVRVSGIVTEEKSELLQDLVDHARVSGGKTVDNDENRLDVSRSDAVVSSAPPETGADLLESKSGAETSDHDAEGDIVARVSRDGTENVVDNSERLQGDAKVSGDETGIRMDSDEKCVDVSSSDAVVSFAPSEIVADLLESKSGTLVVETSDHDGGGENVARDSFDDTKVSRDGTEIGIENSELVLDKSISDAVVSSLLHNRDIDATNGVKLGADLLGSETETLTMKPSADQNGGGDIDVQGSIDDSRVSGGEKEVVMENIEKASDENEANNEEKEGEYKVTDLVWAKVKNYPWWPGQIFDPSSSTDKAKKHSNKKGLLVGYFGDQSFAWNKPSNIKPFRKHFYKLEKQSNSKPFLHAVNCALDEVSRRVDCGLVCSCISKEVRDKIRSQVFVNSGIREEDSKIDGTDRFSTVSTLKPMKVAQSVQELAREHFDGFNRLEVLSMRTQLLAFFRWKGYYQFQAQDILDGVDDKLEDESELPLTEENKVVEDEKPASTGKKVSSKKRKPDVNDSDDSVPRKKERSLANMTPKGNSNVKRSKKIISKEATSDDDDDDDVVFKGGNGNEKPASVGKKDSSKKQKSVVSDGDESVPRKKERSLANMTPKGSSSVKRSKKDISKEATPDDDDVFKDGNGNKKQASVGNKVSSKKRKPDVSDSDDSIPLKKERSSTNVTPKGGSSVKRSKKSVSKEATPDDTVSNEGNGNEEPASVGRKVYSKRRKPVVSDRNDSAPHKKERNKKSVSKEATPDDDDDDGVFKEGNENENPASEGKKVSSKKRKPDVSDSDDSVPRKKEKSLANMTPKGKSSVKRSKKSISKKAIVEDDVSNKENGNGTEDKKSSVASPKKLFRVGDSICRIAKQISESPSILKKESQKSNKEEES